MPSVLDSVMDRISGGNLRQLSQAVGADESSTRDALGTALPLILAGLAKNASRPEGAAALDDALAKDHDGSLLDRAPDFIGGGDTTPGEGILRHVFGDRREVVEKGVSRTSGLDAGQAARLLAMAAPLVMAALGRKRREDNLGPGSLGPVLERQNRDLQQAEPGLGGLARLLDADNDGSIADDVIGGLGRLFRR